DVMSRPLSYIEFAANSTDGNSHQVSAYFDAGADLVVNTPDQQVTASRLVLDGQPLLRMGSRDQAVLAKKGDDIRIDWGYLYLMADRAEGSTLAEMGRDGARAAFQESGVLPKNDDFADTAGNRHALAITLDLGNVAAVQSTRYLMLAYDYLYSIEYFQRKER